MNRKSTRRICIVALTLLMGLGLALALPALAQARRSVGDREAPHDGNTEFKNNILQLTKSAALTKDHRSLLTAPHAPNATITVNNYDDSAGQADGACTLREAIANANADTDTSGNDCAAGSGADTIVFAGSYTITLNSALPVISTTVTIDGASQSIAVDGDSSYRVFEVTASGNLTVTKLTIAKGHAEDGGGIYNAGVLAVANSAFYSNTATGSGGGIFNASGATLTSVDSSAFSGNSAALGGGICNFYGAITTIANSTFSGNGAFQGGGIFNFSTITSLANSTFTGNTASVGGGMYNGFGTTQVYNSILWNNQDSSGTGTITATVFITNSTITLTHSLVQGTGGSGSWITDTKYVNGGGNLDTDPFFTTPISPTNAPTTTGNLRLLYGSPAIDVGDNQYITVATDLDGNPRIVNGIVDMGAYEYQGLCFVEANGDNQTDFISLDASAVQQAVDAAAPGALLKVAGTCR